MSPSTLLERESILSKYHQAMLNLSKGPYHTSVSRIWVQSFEEDEEEKREQEEHIGVTKYEGLGPLGKQIVLD